MKNYFAVFVETSSSFITSSVDAYTFRKRNTSRSQRSGTYMLMTTSFGTVIFDHSVFFALGRSASAARIGLCQGSHRRVKQLVRGPTTRAFLSCRNRLTRKAENKEGRIKSSLVGIRINWDNINP